MGYLCVCGAPGWDRGLVLPRGSGTFSMRKAEKFYAHGSGDHCTQLWVLPVAFNESRVSGSARHSALAGVLCWSSSVISYYSYYTLLLAFWGLPNLEHMLILQEKEEGF